MNKRIFAAVVLIAWSAFAAKQPLSDGAVHDLVVRRLANDDRVKGGALDVDVKDGVVTLRGKVTTDKQKQRAEKLTKKVDGVRSVVNELRVERK